MPLNYKAPPADPTDYPLVSPVQHRKAIHDLDARLDRAERALEAAHVALAEQQEQLVLISGRYHALIEKRAERQKPAKA